MTIYFVTNRNMVVENGRVVDFSGEFGREGPLDFRVGWATVAKPGGRIAIEVAEEAIRDGADPLPEAEQRHGSTEFFARLKKEMMDEQDVLGFIHGYNVTFKEAVAAAMEMERNFRSKDLRLVIVLFSWPSDGSMAPFVAYASDRQDAELSAPATARIILKTRDFLNEIPKKEGCGQKIHLLCHSMGNYVLRNGLQAMIRHEGSESLPRVFDHIFLMAADEDDDAFEKDSKLLYLPRLARRGVHVYFNNEDLAMDVSSVTKNELPRLGNDGPGSPHTVPGKVNLIDCTPVVGGVVEHSYYVDSDRVVTDMVGVLKGAAPKDVEGRDYDPAGNRFRLKP